VYNRGMGGPQGSSSGMSKDAAHTRGWEIGEVVFGVPLLLAVALHFLLPLTFIRILFTLPVFILGIVFCAVGLGLMSATRRELARYRQPTDPGQPTRALVTTGVFTVSRNPMYLGASFFVVGIALAFKLGWLLILLVPTLMACQIILIAPEERYLAAKFGAEYQAYAASVRRLLGRKAR
jgi:protein-S-isoprenylcysteine O-methyltransferase Ste14